MDELERLRQEALQDQIAAAMRHHARILRCAYEAFLEQGFGEEQALEMTLELQALMAKAAE